MPTVSVLERNFLKFISANTPRQHELRWVYTAKFIETMQEKGLAARVGGKWRLTQDGEDAILQRPEIRRAHSMGDPVIVPEV